jgi:leader peptidase (prepilin peptidase)/N-methyltransferase
MFSAGGIPIASAVLASIPAGWLVWLFVRKEAGGRAHLQLPAMAITVAISLWGALVIPANYLLVATLVLGWALVALSMVDYLALRLPDILTFPLVGCGLLLSYWLPQRDLLSHLIGAAAGFAVLYAIGVAYWRTRRQEGLGLGDAKLAAAAGAWLGWQALPIVLLIACAAGFVWIGIAAARRGRAALREQIPFGVPLCFAFWIVWLYGVPDLGAIV